MRLTAALGAPPRADRDRRVRHGPRARRRVRRNTLGYDFLAYHAAAVRVLDGKAAYDTSFQGAGGFGLFYYPPIFVPMILPFGLPAAGMATWAWIGLLMAAFAIVDRVDAGVGSDARG